MAKTATYDLGAQLHKWEEYVNNVCRVTAGLFRDELTEAARSAIEDFYASYSPEYYRRHYYNFRENSFEKYYAHHGKYYYGGVRWTPENMEDIYGTNKYPAPATEVFDMVVTGGFHGPQSAFDFGYGNETKIPPMWPSPRELVLRKREELLKDKDKYIAQAKQMVKR